MKKDDEKIGYTLYLDKRVIAKLKEWAREDERSPSRNINMLLKEKFGIIDEYGKDDND